MTCKRLRYYHRAHCRGTPEQRASEAARSAREAFEKAAAPRIETPQRPKADYAALLRASFGLGL